jgi:hypothetical protein
MAAGAEERTSDGGRDSRGRGAPASPRGSRRLSLVHGVPPPRVLLLGPVDLQHAGGPVEVSARPRLLELAAYLVLMPGRGRAALDAAMWPGRRVGAATRRALIARLRRWLGSDPNGEPYVLPYRPERGFRLHPMVTTDWSSWRLLLPRQPASAATQDLEAALALVRGRPFEDAAAAHYAWAEALMSQMTTAVAGAAQELAGRYQARGDCVLGDHAAAIGRRVDPGHEGLRAVGQRRFLD